MNTIDCGFKDRHELPDRQEEPKDSREGRGVSRGPIREAGGDRLESKYYKVNRQIERVKVSRKRCGCRVCPTCRKRLGWETRQVMLAKKHLFRSPGLLTLTIDRKGTITGEGFSSSKDAHACVTDNKLIPILMRLIGIKIWLWVLEWQEGGWPHWHILVDLSHFPGGRLPKEVLERIWRLWRDKWGIGGVDLQVRKSFNDSAHAINYLTKYLLKEPKYGLPEWLAKESKVRFVAASKAVGRLVFKGSSPRKNDSTAKKERRCRYRTYAVRVEQCGLTSTVYSKTVCEETGEERFSFFGQLPLSPDELVEIGEFCYGTVRFYKDIAGVDAKTGKPFEGVFMDTPYNLNMTRVVKAVNRDIKRRGLLKEHLDKAQYRLGLHMPRLIFYAEMIAG